MAHDPQLTVSGESEIHYKRLGGIVHLRLRGLTNHEIRAFVVGLAHRLEADDRLDLIEELRHHEIPGSSLSAISAAVAQGQDSR